MFATRMPIISIACAAGMLAACGTAAGQYYVATVIGPLPEQPGPTWAWDINDNGVVFGTGHVNGSRESRCFLFDDDTATIFASDEGHPFIWAGAINNATAFVGTQMVTAPFGTNRKSFVGLPETLPDLFAQFPSGDSSHGRDINNSVAGAAPWAVGSQRLDEQIGVGAHSTFGGYLVLLDGNPNPPIAVPALGGTFVRAEALNDARDVVGASLTSTGALRAFFRPGAGGATINLGTLGGSHSWATDISNARQIVGWSHRISDGGTRAFLHENSTMTNLGTLGGHISQAHAINESSEIVGMSFNAQAKPRAFLYRNGAMIDLNARIAADAGFVLQHACAINESGSIVGWGRHEGETRGFLLTPRGPGDVTLDGTVDVDDLVELILAWGPCPPAGDPCAADAAPHPAGDGQVNVDDLIAVLLNWS